MKVSKFDSAVYLNDKEPIFAYLSDAVANEDAHGIVDALSIVTHVLGGVPRLAETVGLDESLIHIALRDTVSPDLAAISIVLRGLGVGFPTSLVA